MVVVAIVVVVVLRIFRGNKGVSTQAHVLAGQLALLHSSVHHLSNTSIPFQTLIALHTFCVRTTVGVVVVVVGVVVVVVGVVVVVADRVHLQDDSGQLPLAQLSEHHLSKYGSPAQ